MIEFYSETEFKLDHQQIISEWISKIISLEGLEEGDISYVFCDDAYLHKLNVEFLDHDTLTDIISFDYSMGNAVSGEIYISVERVAENAMSYSTSFEEELHRVMIHGILHYCGYLDKSEAELRIMREKENLALSKLELLKS